VPPARPGMQGEIGPILTGAAGRHLVSVGPFVDIILDPFPPQKHVGHEQREPRGAARPQERLHTTRA